MRRQYTAPSTFIPFYVRWVVDVGQIPADCSFGTDQGFPSNKAHASLYACLYQIVCFELSMWNPFPDRPTPHSIAGLLKYGKTCASLASFQACPLPSIVRVFRAADEYGDRTGESPGA